MDALPDELSTSKEEEELPTGLGCVECPGVLRVLREGRSSYFLFRCRIGHEYGTIELLEAKEGKVESSLWSAVLAAEELAHLLTDLRRCDSHYKIDGMEDERRASELLVLANELRRLIRRNDPIDLAPVPPPDTEDT